MTIARSTIDRLKKETDYPRFYREHCTTATISGGILSGRCAMGEITADLSTGQFSNDDTSGDVFTFLMHENSLTFPDAVRYLRAWS